MTKIIQHIKPNLKMPEMMCDIPLSKHLETDPILKYLNKTFTCGVIGKKGSGKSSIIISWLQTKNKLKKVFYQVFVFMPSTSRASIKNSVYSKLPEDQIFENVSFENLQYVYDILKENSENVIRSPFFNLAWIMYSVLFIILSVNCISIISIKFLS
jgi:hypothetical protein